MTHQCVLCKKDRAGRFTRRNSGASGAWTKGSLPAWFCWACLPPGQGRDEDEETAMAKKPAAAQVIDIGSKPPATLLADKREGLALQTSLQVDVLALKPIQSDADYLKADILFGRIKQARKTWNLKWYGTKDKPGPIPTIRAGLEQLYSINREIDKPLGEMEEAVESAMKTFKLAELRRLREADEQRLREEEEARAEVERLAARKEAVKTAAAKARIEEQLEKAEATLTDVQSTAMSEAIRGLNSYDTPKKVVNVPDVSAFIGGVAGGTIPEDCLTVNMVRLRAYYKEDPEAVAMFPGVSIDDDIQIKGR